MADLGVRYLGLELRNPLIASSSPLTGSIDTLRALEAHGIGAVVLPSLFEEDVESELAEVGRFAHAGCGTAEVHGGYLPERMMDSGHTDRYLDLVREASATLSVPVIGSLNGVSDTGWSDVARLVEAAGAAAIELNLYDLPLDLSETGPEVEDRVLALVRHVRSAVSLPIAVKVGPYYSAFGAMARAITAAGADGLVLFNRLYQPDVDVVRPGLRHDLTLSHRHEMRLPLLWLSTLRGRLDGCLAGSTGVETPDDVVRYLLAGADAVMTASALLRHGPQFASELVAGLKHWLEARNFGSVGEACGLLASRRGAAAGYGRATYRSELHSYRSPTRDP